MRSSSRSSSSVGKRIDDQTSERGGHVVSGAELLGGDGTDLAVEQVRLA